MDPRKLGVGPLPAFCCTPRRQGRWVASRVCVHTLGFKDKQHPLTKGVWKNAWYWKHVAEINTHYHG